MAEDPTATQDFFDPSFLAELEGLAAREQDAPAPSALPSALGEKLAEFLRLSPEQPPLDEEAFVRLSPAALHERADRLMEICRAGAARQDTRQAIENFVVFFQALLPGLKDESGGAEIKRFFFRLAPTLLQIAHRGFAADEKEGTAALRNLETILIEISNVRLAPSEKELVFRNIDHMAGFIAVGEYAMANEAISSQLLAIIRGNKLTRALFRLMEVEANIQVYLKERFGYLTPQIALPEDVSVLTEYGPIQVLEDETPAGERKCFIQVHIPEIPILRDIVLRMVGEENGRTFDLRLDSLGSVELSIPPGRYSLGLVYEPEAS